MPGVVVIFDCVTGILPLVIHLVFLHVALIDVLGGHAEGLGEGYEEVKQIDDLYAGVLFIDLLVFGPPFPGKAIDQFGQFLAHGAGIIEGPFGFFIGREIGQVDPDFFVQKVLHTEDFLELVSLGHREFVATGAGRRRLFCSKTHRNVKKSGSELDGVESNR